MTTAKAGVKVGATLSGWRELRTKCPELVEDQQLSVWQSPAAYVDMADSESQRLT